MTKTRLDQEVVNRGLVASRSQAESYIKLGKVKVNGKVASKPSVLVSKDDKIQMIDQEQYVSRAGLKLASVAKTLNLDFKDKIVLDVGSSTGGFTDYALKRGAKKVVAVDVGTDQMHPSLLGNPRLELHEKTDIRQFCLRQTATSNKQLAISVEIPDMVLIDVSFISLRDILPHISKLITQNSLLDLREVARSEGELTRAKTVLSEGEVSVDTSKEEKPFAALPAVPARQAGELLRSGDERALRKSSIVVAMVKPQFEAHKSDQKHKGVIKNERIRRDILKDFENWIQNGFVVLNKADSEVSGAKGNTERFYVLAVSK